MNVLLMRQMEIASKMRRKCLRSENQKRGLEALVPAAVSKRERANIEPNAKCGGKTFHLQEVKGGKWKYTVPADNSPGQTPIRIGKAEERNAVEHHVFSQDSAHSELTSKSLLMRKSLSPLLKSFSPVIRAAVLTSPIHCFSDQLHAAVISRES